MKRELVFRSEWAQVFELAGLDLNFPFEKEPKVLLPPFPNFTTAARLQTFRSKCAPMLYVLQYHVWVLSPKYTISLEIGLNLNPNQVSS